MNGILLVDKPADWTSHDVVAKLRGVLGERRMGHSGTLDPMATGLLVVFAGRATRAVSFSENHSKCYEARLRLGLTTDTQDTTGTVLSRCDRRVTRAELEAALPQFRGDILQTPPMYSALKVDGQKLYEIARRGGEVARKTRPITIEELTVLGEADMMNLAVGAEHRRQGIAAALVNALCAALRAENGAELLTLEVRDSNEAAIRLYAALGFTEIGRRPNYYFHPKEDARILRKDLTA